MFMYPDTCEKAQHLSEALYPFHNEIDLKKEPF